MELINVLEATNVSSACGQIPAGVFNIVSLIIMLVQIVVPILLIIWGMLDFGKAVVGGDEEKIKAAQKIFLKRLIAAILVFLIVTIVKMIVDVVGDIGAEGTNANGVWTCVKDFINGKKTTTTS